jgi:hypothetical protein
MARTSSVLFIVSPSSMQRHNRVKSGRTGRIRIPPTSNHCSAALHSRHLHVNVPGRDTTLSALCSGFLVLPQMGRWYVRRAGSASLALNEGLTLGRHGHLDVNLFPVLTRWGL